MILFYLGEETYAGIYVFRGGVNFLFSICEGWGFIAPLLVIYDCSLVSGTGMLR